MTDPAPAPPHAAARRHEALGASFTDFGGWLMPVRYTSDLAEHHAVRTAAGIFDISHMAEFLVEGREAGDFLDYALAGPALHACRCGRRSTACCSTARAGSSTTSSSTASPTSGFFVVANAGNHDPVAAALAERGAGFEASVVDASDDYALIAVQGPDRPGGARGDRRHHRPRRGRSTSFRTTRRVRRVLRGRAAADRPHRLHRGGRLRAVHRRLRRRALWDALLAAGAPLGLVPAGLAARDTLRLEAGHAALRPRALARHRSRPGRPRPRRRRGQERVRRSRGRPRRRAGRRAGARRPRLRGQARRPRRLRSLRTATTAWARSRAVRSARPSSIRSPWPSSRPPRRAEGTVLTIDVRGTRIPATVSPALLG